MQISPHKKILTTFLGVTLIELLVVLAILGIVLAAAVPGYQMVTRKVDIATVKVDMNVIEQRIEIFFTANNRYPFNASELGGMPNDPWGNPYIYLNIGIQKGKGKLRKDKNLVPINSDYDLYSKGPDGKSVSPLTAKSSRDDIIRANNGAFIGVAEDY